MQNRGCHLFNNSIHYSELQKLKGEKLWFFSKTLQVWENWQSTSVNLNLVPKKRLELFLFIQIISMIQNDSIQCENSVLKFQFFQKFLPSFIWQKISELNFSQFPPFNFRGFQSGIDKNSKIWCELVMATDWSVKCKNMINLSMNRGKNKSPIYQVSLVWHQNQKNSSN